jgi:hypothetical protein
MLREIVTEYGLPLAVTLSVGLGSMAINNATSIAVLESETHSMVDVQKEMIKEIKTLNRVMYRVEAKLEAQNEQR